MPSKTPRQQRFMKLVYAYKKGEVKKVSPEVKKAAKSLTDKQLKEFMKLKGKKR